MKKDPKIPTKYLVPVLTAVGLVALFAAFSFWQVKGPGGLAKPSPKFITATPEVPGTIVIKNYAFVPAIYKVLKGDKVTWRNDDNVAHTVTALALGGQHVLRPGGSFTLDTKDLFLEGEITYKDDFSTLTGTLLVVTSKAESAFAKLFNSLTATQQNCIKQSLSVNRLFELRESDLPPSVDEQQAINRCTTK